MPDRGKSELTEDQKELVVEWHGTLTEDQKFDYETEWMFNKSIDKHFLDWLYEQMEEDW